MATPYHIGDLILNRYRVTSISQGGMGYIFHCTDIASEFNLNYVLKVPKKKLGDLKAFKNEVKNWMICDGHNNVVSCYLLFEINDRFHLVLESVENNFSGRGSSLRSFMNSYSINYRESLEILIDICRGLHFITNKVPGFIHKDLKPENILINDNKTAKITDLGLSILVSEINEECILAGTPAYMAPELWSKDNNIDNKVDIYSIGIILYELAVKEHPFKKFWEMDLETLKRHHLESPVKIPKQIPQGIQDIINRCISKDSNDRINIDDLIPLIEKCYYGLFGHSIKPLDDGSIKIGTLEEGRLNIKSELNIFELSASKLNNKGVALRKIGEIEMALELLKKAIEADKNFFMAYNNLGNVYSQMGEYDNAFKYYNQALEINPSFIDALISRAGLNVHIGRLSLAIEDATQAIYINPKSPDGWYIYGTTLQKRDQHEEAIKVISMAIEIMPKKIYFISRATSFKMTNQIEQAYNDLIIAQNL